MQQLKVTIKGLSPLLMHADRLANPLDPVTKAHKAMTVKPKKTDSEHEAIAKSEWLASLYYRDGVGVYIPGQNIDACLKDAAKMQKLGKKFTQAVMVLEDEVPLQYKGPKKPDALFEEGFVDVRGVKVSQAKVMRYRPKFNEWGAAFTVAFNDDLVNLDALRRAIADAGSLIGLCDYRPRFGKFTAEVQ
jgi:hypothetical protein